jgi:hypothetical protein
MLRWLFSWEEAAKRPWRTVISVFLLGFVCAGLYGYFRFGNRTVVWGLVLGLSVGLVLGALTWRTVRDPARVAELTQRHGESHIAERRRSAVRLALPFIALGIAAAAGAASHSVNVFAVTLAAGLVASLLLRRFVPR